MAAELLRAAMAVIESSSTISQLSQIHAFFTKISLDRNRFVLTRFLTKCSIKQNHIIYARRIFDLYPSRDTFIWNTIIHAYLIHKNPFESLSLYHQMRFQDGVSPDGFTLSFALQACNEKKNGEMLHSEIVKFGFLRDLCLQTTVFEMYSKFGDILAARFIFDEMPEKDLVSYNAMMSVYIAHAETKEARRLFDCILEKDVISWNTMINGYVSVGDMSAVREMFDKACERDLISWSTMISGYAQSRSCYEALKLFHEMRIAGLVPDKITLASVAAACGNIGALGIGKSIHNLIEKNEIEVDLRLGTSLVDMYSKCGDVENAIIIFEKMSKRDAVAWSTIVIGLANHGLGKLALNFYLNMLSDGVTPIDITFVGVLTACSHAGLVDQGQAHFRSMSDVYGINPKVEHYACMVDLLGKAGKVEDAKELINRMPFEPDAVVWRALLGACQIHKHVDIAEETIIKLTELEPHVDGHYVLLSNIYAQANKWNEVAKVRKMIKVNNVQRVPGISSIEIDNRVYEFLASDRSFPMYGEVYKMLEEMIERIKQLGYQPMTSLVLPDIEENSRENLLAEHSEKLAIAFGLVKTPSKSTIRIFKNLRTCEDCHSAVKLISLAYERRLIVRDRNRFHHFVEGKCSCGDYW